MTSSPIDEIKSRLDIVEVIGSYIKLQKAGANYRAACPFHSEKKPSFFVSPARQLWRCFGCQKGGDVFGFIKEIEGIEFGDALRILAARAGVELKRQDPEVETERKRLYEICELAASFFGKQLEASRVGQEAKKYLLKRKISEESIKGWRLGYAPNTWRGLSDFIVSRGFRREEAEKAGLVIRSEKSKSYYDRFRGRIMFPVFDISSQIIGFGGRIFEPDKKADNPEAAPKEKEVLEEVTQQSIAKYVNSPATILYDKSQVLYGLDRARVAIRKKDACVTMEGYVDVIMAAQEGFENVVAASGTALTTRHLKIIKRYSENLITAFDMDIAGNTATKRGIELAQAEGFNIKVIVMPEENDPADIISQSPQEWEKLAGEAKSIMEFYFESAFAKTDPKTVDGKKKIAKELLAVIKIIPNKIEQRYWLDELAKKLRVEKEDLEEEMAKVKVEMPGVNEVSESVAETVIKSRKQLLEERLLALMIKSPESLALVGDKELSYFSSPCMRIYTHLKEKGCGQVNLTDGLEPELCDFANYLCLMADNEDVGAVNTIEELKYCLKEFKILNIKQKLDEFSKLLKSAERENDDNKIEVIMREFNLCSKSLRELEQG